MAWSLDDPNYTVDLNFNQPMDTGFNAWSNFDLSDSIGATLEVQGEWISPTQLRLSFQMDAAVPPPAEMVYTPAMDPQSRLKSALGVEMPGGTLTNFTPA